MGNPLRKVWLQLQVHQKVAVFTGLVILLVLCHLSSVESSVADVLEPDDLQHLVEAVGDAGTVLLSDFLWGEVGCDDREQLVVVSVLEQVNDGADHVSEVQHLGRLLAQVVNGEHLLESVLLELIEVFGNLGDVLGVHNPQADAELLAQEFEMATPMQIIDGALQGVEKRSFAVAAGAAHHHAEPRVWLREVSGQRKQVGLSVRIKHRVAMPPLHLQRIVGSQHVQRLKGGHVEPKT